MAAFPAVVQVAREPVTQTSTELLFSRLVMTGSLHPGQPRCILVQPRVPQPGARWMCTPHCRAPGVSPCPWWVSGSKQALPPAPSCSPRPPRRPPSSCRENTSPCGPRGHLHLCWAKQGVGGGSFLWRSPAVGQAEQPPAQRKSTEPCAGSGEPAVTRCPSQVTAGPWPSPCAPASAPPQLPFTAKVSRALFVCGASVRVLVFPTGLLSAPPPPLAGSWVCSE